MKTTLRPNPQPFIDDFHRVQKSSSRWEGLTFPDPVLIVVISLLLAIGLVAITSSSIVQALATAKSGYFYLKNQGLYIILGFILGYFFYLCNEKILLKLATIIPIAATILLVVMPFISDASGGAHRWIKFAGFSVQVSEILKIGLLLFVAKFISLNQREIQVKTMRVIGVLFGITAFPLILLIIQPDFGTTVLLVAFIFALLFLAGANLWKLLTIVSVGVVLLIGAFAIEPYRVRRFFAFLDPWEDPLGVSYQLTRALIAIFNGGWTGVGLGEGIIKHRYLPEIHNDFIFANIAEETGVLGGSIIIILFAVFLWRCFIIAARAARVRRYFASYYAYGVGIMIFFQALIHIGVNIGILPTKGLTLPFISYGGSSVVTLCIIIGILLRIDSETHFQAQREGKA